MTVTKPSIDQRTIAVHENLAAQIQAELGQNIFLCYQCLKCSNGCPLSDFFDYQPHQIMRLLQLGEDQSALQAQTPWLCASCQTCSTRCPQGLDIAAIMAYLTRQTRARRMKPKVPQVDAVNRAFLRGIRLWGRIYEIGLMAEVKLRTGQIREDMDLGMRMLRKGKLSLLPEWARPPRRPRPVAAPRQTLGYYPGCSLHSTAVEYDLSTQAVCHALGIRLYEPPGWICCGSTPIHRSHPQEALRLPLENLRLVAESGLEEVIMPCAACFNHHKMALYEVREHPERLRTLSHAPALEIIQRVRVRSLLEAIFEHVGTESLRAQVRQPLQGLRLVCYYGCLLTRPPEVTGAPRPENPMQMEALLEVTGAEVRDWSYKTVCCGATHSLTRPDIVLDLSHTLIEQAQRAGAEAIAVACPLCHANLDARQFQMKLEKPLPVLYFTQLLGLALGVPTNRLGLEKNLVDVRPLFREKGLLIS